MKRLAINSTSIASIGYEPLQHQLEIEFRDSGEVYRYFGVSAEEYAAFLKAESKGTYLNQVFKLMGHPYIIVKRSRH
jgi:hypothetical protein